MAYVAARGGEAAIQEAEALFRRLNGTLDAGLVQQIERQLPYLVDRVMSEGSLYAPELAALAIAQTGGDLYEAILLLRAYRSTQPRVAYAAPVDPATMQTLRRISAAFKDIPGGQILGPTLDYSHRLLRTDLLDGDAQGEVASEQPTTPESPAILNSPIPPVTEWLRLNGLLAALPPQPPADPALLPDVTREAVRFPAPRAQRLQSLARADTGGVLALGYASMRGYGLIHPTVNEVRLGYADVLLEHPISGVRFSAGRVRVSMAEVVSSHGDTLELGYAATLGWNEVKVIAGAMLDLEMDKPNPHPAHDEEFVLYHTEPVESSGFCIHYKLPHYVTFSSNLDALRRAREMAAEESE
ncbi:phosphonate metabolism protein PhnI [Oscillochloris trichoides DG-6]|uniref:Phosphonate metabolism protein PhnI n=1 Tax=Oscillochloris trichoides DG-6 TaxID=765420 RepID=E1IFF2_9CHLR|nr:carbon-phosphorus lyase complex subunit PhnI [Oscillochloris trichoides]EFO80062.1 phosphonate metabolism protein PhnI [Oscillochloris trichoides DG-6]